MFWRYAQTKLKTKSGITELDKWDSTTLACSDEDKADVYLISLAQYLHPSQSARYLNQVHLISLYL